MRIAVAVLAALETFYYRCRMGDTVTILAPWNEAVLA